MAGAEPPQHEYQGQPQGELDGGFLPAFPNLIPDGDAERGEDQDDDHGFMVAEDQYCCNSQVAACF